MENNKNERKKRKMETEEKEEETEEEKMEQFYALLRNTKDMRNRLRSSAQIEEKKTLSSLWSPSFQPEDFMEDSNSNVNTNQVGGSSSSNNKRSEQEKHEQRQQEEDGGKNNHDTQHNLDLNLSL